MSFLSETKKRKKQYENYCVCFFLMNFNFFMSITFNFINKPKQSKPIHCPLYEKKNSQHA